MTPPPQGYDSMFSFKYSPRPNTLASKRLLDDVRPEVKTARIVALQALQRQIQSELHEAAVGSDVDVLVDSVSRRQSAELSGRTMGNTVVNFRAPADTSSGRIVDRHRSGEDYERPSSLTARQERQERHRSCVARPAHAIG